MKFKNILLLSLSSLLLVSCGNNAVNPIDPNPDDSKNNDITIKDSFFTELKKGYILTTKVSETINNETKYFLEKVEHNGKAYSSFVYSYADTLDTATNKTLTTSETYYELEEDGTTYVANGRLGINNKIKLSKIKYGNDLNYAEFEKYGFSNFFNYFSASTFSTMFDKVSGKENTYSLKETYKDNIIGTAISTQLYGQPGLNLDSFVLEFNNDGIKAINASLEYTTSTKIYDYTIDATIEAKGNINFEEAYKPFEAKEDTNFDSFYNDVKNKNYTLYIQNYEGSTQTSYITLLLDQNKFTYILGDEDGEETTINAIKKTDGSCYSITSTEDGDGNDGYQYSNAMDKKLFDNIIPSLDISGDIFTYDENKYEYVVKNGITDTMDSIVGFEVNADVIDELSMQLYVYEGVPNQYIITNKHNDSITYITITNCGSTTIAFNEENIKEKTSWKESLFAKASDYNILKVLLNNDTSILPIPANMDQEGERSIEGNITDNSSSTMKLIYNVTGAYDDDTILDYYLLLLDYEWEMDEDNFCFYKQINNKKLKAEVLVTEDAPNKFYIQFSYVNE